MNAIIVSDVHIGSRYFLYDNFERFLGNVSEVINDNYSFPSTTIKIPVSTTS